ncbi:hypothetical protein KA062_01175 [Patescibacteria group bacterium]|nr:hypothetical protein [Patescibacteria group bacterium]
MTNVSGIPKIETPSTPQINEAAEITEGINNIDERGSSIETDGSPDLRIEDMTDEKVRNIAETRKTDGLMLAEKTLSPMDYEKEVLNEGKELGVLPSDSYYKEVQEKIIDATEKYIEDVDKIQNYVDEEISKKTEETPEDTVENKEIEEINIQEEARWWGFTDDKKFSPETQTLVENNPDLNDLLKDFSPEEQEIFEEMYHKIFDTLPPEEKNRLLEEKNIINNILKQETEKDNAEEFRKLMIRLAVKVSVKVAVTILKNIQKSSESKAAKVTCGTLADLLEAGGKEFDKAYTGEVNPEDLTIALRNHFFEKA